MPIHCVSAITRSLRLNGLDDTTKTSLKVLLEAASAKTGFTLKL